MVTIETIETTNYILALGTVGIAILTAILLYDLKTKRALAHHVDTWGMWLAFVITAVGTILTLVYSEVFGVVPCGLCWLERVLLWPQPLIVLTALYFKERVAPRYGIVLSFFGLIVSLYHHYIQMGGSQFITCPSTGAGADCAKRFFFEFGFITFPFMAAVLFAFLIALYTYILKIRTQGFRMVE